VRRANHFRLRTVVLLSLLFLIASCGTPCQQIRGDRQRFLARDTSPENGEQPQLSLEVPFALLNRLLAESVSELPSVPVPSPVGGRLKRYLGGIKLIPRALTLGPAPKGLVGLRLVLALSHRGDELVDVIADLHLRPRLDTNTKDMNKQRLILSLRGEDLRGLRPRITEGGAERLTKAIRKSIPRAARALIPKKTVRAAANTIIDRASAQAFAALRDGALRRLGQVAQISLDLPPVPVADARISSNAKVLRVDITTALPVRQPVRQGLRPRARQVRFADDTALLRISGACVAELANWAISEGKIPARYDDKGRPDAKGPFEAALGWREEARPFKVHVWRLGEPCLQARLGGTPALRVKGNKLKASVKDVKLEELKGPALYELGAFFYALFGPTFDLTKELASAFQIKVGAKESLKLTLKSAKVTRYELALTVTAR
jgi:hypothetical protein